MIELNEYAEIPRAQSASYPENSSSKGLFTGRRRIQLASQSNTRKKPWWWSSSIHPAHSSKFLDHPEETIQNLHPERVSDIKTDDAINTPQGNVKVVTYTRRLYEDH